MAPDVHVLHARKAERMQRAGDGLADIGWVGSLWEPAKQPLQNAAYYSPFVTGDFRALAEVQNQLMEKVPAFAAEWTKHNTVYLGAQVAEVKIEEEGLADRLYDRGDAAP